VQTGIGLRQFPTDLLGREIGLGDGREVDAQQAILHVFFEDQFDHERSDAKASDEAQQRDLEVHDGIGQ
jgi:hypothetical protein